MCMYPSNYTQAKTHIFQKLPELYTSLFGLLNAKAKAKNIAFG